MKRIGYIGLSAPSFYDYRTPASRAPSDGSSSPNPILEGAFGAMLLYDELWFLCRSLCPENMRSLPYVKFLDEIDSVPEINQEWLPAADQVFDTTAIAAFNESSSAYNQVKKQARVHWEGAFDNHTHGLKIGNKTLNGNSWSIKNVLFDILVVDRLGDTVELVTNSFTARLFRTEASARRKLELSEILVLDSVPQFLSAVGPYHPCLEEVRESKYLKDFRQWIQTESGFDSPKAVKDVKDEIDAKLAESQREVFLKYLDPRGSYTSLAETMLGVGMDTLLPGTSTIKDLVKLWREEKQKAGFRWQGFILDARSKLSRTLK
jgi:hypothetical protein